MSPTLASPFPAIRSSTATEFPMSLVNSPLITLLSLAALPYHFNQSLPTGFDRIFRALVQVYKDQMKADSILLEDHGAGPYLRVEWTQESSADPARVMVAMLLRSLNRLVEEMDAWSLLGKLPEEQKNELKDFYFLPDRDPAIDGFLPSAWHKFVDHMSPENILLLDTRFFALDNSLPELSFFNTYAVATNSTIPQSILKYYGLRTVWLESVVGYPNYKFPAEMRQYATRENQSELTFGHSIENYHVNQLLGHGPWAAGGGKEPRPDFPLHAYNPGLGDPLGPLLDHARLKTGISSLRLEDVEPRFEVRSESYETPLATLGLSSVTYKKVYRHFKFIEEMVNFPIDVFVKIAETNRVETLEVIDALLDRGLGFLWNGSWDMANWRIARDRPELKDFKAQYHETPLRYPPRDQNGQLE